MTGHRLIGIYIDLGSELDEVGAQRTIHVKETADGTILLTSPNPDCPLTALLNHINGKELRMILDGLYIRDAGGCHAREA